MKGMTRFFKIIMFLILGNISIHTVNAQGALCSDIEPFCAGEERLTFPNSNRTNSPQSNGEIGPDYGCLEEQPYPAWFFLQIEDAGNLTFRLSQFENADGTGAPLDVDFVVWGPFRRGDEYCSSRSLTSAKIVDCSYLPDAVETMQIPGAREEEVYVVLITNFQQLPGFISLEQSNTGQGSTDCTILDLDLGDNISVCGESEYVIDGSSNELVNYEWFEFNTSTSQYDRIVGEDGPTLTVTESGNYKVIITDELGTRTEEDDVDINFYDRPAIGTASNVSICDEDAEFVDLTVTAEDLISANAGDPDNFEVNYYDNEGDIAIGESITQPRFYTYEEGKTIYAEVFDKEKGCASEIKSFQLELFDFPEIDIPESLIVCVDLEMQVLNPVTVGLDLGPDYYFEWRDGDEILSTDPVYNIDQLPEDLELDLIIGYIPAVCEVERSIEILPVSRPASVNVEITGSDFGEGFTVIAEPEGFIGEEYASFVYRLDNGNWQDSNSFTDVPPGNHTVSVRELNGCGSTTSEEFFLVGYPRFFSPNNDGYNDNWNIISDSNIDIKKLFVFDRYGKLIVKLDGGNRGWDGTYNGSELPSDDYWFRIEFINESTGEYQEYMANFTLLR